MNFILIICLFIEELNNDRPLNTNLYYNIYGGVKVDAIFPLKTQSKNPIDFDIPLSKQLIITC